MKLTIEIEYNPGVLSFVPIVVLIKKLSLLCNVKIKAMKKKSEYNLSFIQSIVSEETGIDIEDMNANTRKREVVEARQLAHFFAKKKTKNSLGVIGLEIGDKDHATVLHSIKTVQNLMDSNKKFREKFDRIDAKL